MRDRSGNHYGEVLYKAAAATRKKKRRPFVARVYSSHVIQPFNTEISASRYTCVDVNWLQLALRAILLKYNVPDWLFADRGQVSPSYRQRILPIHVVCAIMQLLQDGTNVSRNLALALNMGRKMRINTQNSSTTDYDK